MRRIFQLSLLICWSWTVHAQSGMADSIHQLEYKIETFEQSIQEVKAELEVLKLRKIKEQVKAVGMAAPIDGEQIIHHDALALSYNEDHEQANYVVHMVTKDILAGNVSRTNDFRLDPKVATVTADSADYWDSGYDRGHLAPSADFRWSQKALSQSYFYSNMTPQRPELNRESWARLENLVREFAVDAGEVMVVTGPVLRDDLPKIPQGSMRVSIPKLYFKVVVDLYGEEKRGIAFIMENAEAKYRLMDYAVSIDSVESLTGIDFFPALDDETEYAIEANNDYNVWPVSSSGTYGESKPIVYREGTIPVKQAKYYIGEDITVCGLVVSTKYSEKSKTKPTYINLDKKFPDHIFTVVIQGKDRTNFSYIPEETLYNKHICVTGKVDEWNGVPQIYVTNEAALEILE